MDSDSSIDSQEWSSVEAVTNTLLAHVTEEFLLPTEHVAVQVPDVDLVNTHVQGTLLVTNFRLLFVSEEPRQLIPLGTILLATIDKFNKQEKRATPAPRLLQIVGKDTRTLVYAFPPRTRRRKLVFDELTKRLRACLWDLYAFVCGPFMMRNSNPNTRLLQEYLRLFGEEILKGSGKSNNWWRISDVNSNYTVCPTYPTRFIVPSSISDKEVFQAANFRARGRLPVITWCHPENGAVLARSSQPLVGMINTKRSISDEKLVAALSASRKPSGTNTKFLYIVDARPRKNAYANGAMGLGGTESSSNYSQAEVVFLGIENVHAVRESFSRLREYLDTHGSVSSDGLSSHHRNGGWNWGGGNVSVSALGETGWLMHIHNVLAGSAWIAARIALQGASVLVHCSDGWDRTTQLVSLAGLFLDPYYRTFEGFQALIEKDWLAFGHPFADRLGMPRLNTNDNEEFCPIFLQWVDCVAQILGMYPRAFEFSSAYLVEIVDCIFSGRFGNFLCNTENERKQAGVADSCGCMWVYLTDLRKSSGKNNIHEHCNIFYSPDEYPGPILPPPAALAPTLWSRFHLRWNSPLEARARSEVEAQCFKEFRAKEIAENKTKDMETNLESLTEQLETLTVQLVSEKSAHRLAVAVAKRAVQEMMWLKRAMESVGCNAEISGSPDSAFTDIARSEDITEKIMSMWQNELSRIEDINEVQEQKNQEDDMSISLSISVDSDLHESLIRKGSNSRRLKSTDVVDEQINSEFSGVRANYDELENLSIDDSYFKS